MKNLFIASFLFFCFSTAVFAATFDDVPESSGYYKAVEFLKKEGIIHGYENGDFGPEDTLNRAQAMKIIVEAFDVAHDGDYPATFTDVVSDDWFFPYVMGAKEADIAHGYPDGTFKPAREVNLAEALTLIMAATKVDLPETTDRFIFSDVPSDAWYAPYLYYAREKNILMADDAGNIKPEQKMKRGDFAVVIYRTIKVMENNEEPYSIEEEWPLYEGTDLPFQMKYDPSWQVIKNDEEVIFFKPDKDNAQFSTTRLYPNSAKVVVSLDKNEDNLSSASYFANIKNVFADADYKEFTLDGLKALEISYSDARTVDWYIYLQNKNVLAVYTEYGDGVLTFQFPKIIKAMLSTLAYKDVPEGEDYTEILSEIFENVLVEGMGKEMIEKLSDAMIIETDSIGVGTGAVDYYFSENVNYTFKYERSKDVILATKQGKTSSF